MVGVRRGEFTAYIGGDIHVDRAAARRLGGHGYCISVRRGWAILKIIRSG